MRKKGNVAKGSVARYFWLRNKVEEMATMGGNSSNPKIRSMTKEAGDIWKRMSIPERTVVDIIEDAITYECVLRVAR